MTANNPIREYLDEVERRMYGETLPQRVSHHPTLEATNRHGCWATCSCGWQSGLGATVIAAHLEFGQHLTTQPHGTDRAPDTDRSEDA